LADVFILKLTIVTCAFYMGVTLLLFAGLMVLVHSKGMVGYALNWRSWECSLALYGWFLLARHGASFIIRSRHAD